MKEMRDGRQEERRVGGGKGAGYRFYFIMPAGALKHLSEFINATHI